jgi:hypothetical protein
MAPTIRHQLEDQSHSGVVFLAAFLTTLVFHFSIEDEKLILVEN